MKKSNINLSEIPNDWEVIPCGYFFKEKSIKNNIGEINLSVYRDYGVIPKDSRDDNYNRVSDDISNYKLVEKGDFVLNKMKCWMGSLGVSDYRGIVSPSYTVLNPKKEIHNKYFHYLLRSEQYRQIYESLSYGVRVNQWELRFHDFKLIPALYPRKKQQHLIAEYLDKKTKIINSLIEKIKKKIQLIKEHKISIINKNVTKGIDINIEIQNGVDDLIGLIPNNWKVSKLKYLFEECIGGSWGEDPEHCDHDSLVEVIRVSEFDMKNFSIKKKIPTKRSLIIDKSSKKLVRKDDLILEKSGGGVKTPVGRVVLIKKDLSSPTINSNFTNLCRPNNSINPKYLVLSLANQYFIGKTSRNIKQTTGIQNLDIDSYMNEKILVPSKEEQQNIAQFLEINIEKMELLIYKLETKIDLLKEYQKSLISYVVTGKVEITEDML